MTDAQRRTETVTAEQVYDLGHAKGIEAERAKVVSLLGAQEMVAKSEDERDVIWMLRAIIKTGGHWTEKP
jgi:hypothetical protein